MFDPRYHKLLARGQYWFNQTIFRFLSWKMYFFCELMYAATTGKAWTVCKIQRNRAMRIHAIACKEVLCCTVHGHVHCHVHCHVTCRVHCGIHCHVLCHVYCHVYCHVDWRVYFHVQHNRHRANSFSTLFFFSWTAPISSEYSHSSSSLFNLFPDSPFLDR